MTSKLSEIVIDCADPRRVAEFWAAALNYNVEVNDDDEDVEVVSPDGSGPTLLFQKVPEGKSVKNRFHFDLAPDDQAAEVARLEALGAKKVDIGQGDVSWVVMVDPEGSEFCVLTARER